MPVNPKPLAKSAPKTLQLGSVMLTTGAETTNRMAILLWGSATSGKTTFAATAPGKKLWISLGDNEHASVSHRPDVIVANYADMDLIKFWNEAGVNSEAVDNPFGLDRLLADNPEIETVVFDSLTAATYRALQKAVIIDKQGAKRGQEGFVPTMEAPGIAAYGGRNALVLQLTTGLLKVTAKHGVHIILTAHEADPTMKKDDRGNDTASVDFISTQLGGKIIGNMTWRLSEIWFLSERDGVRKLAIRPFRLRRPMKTRMFRTDETKEFILGYNADMPDAAQPHTIAKWYAAWRDSGYEKVPAPKNAKGVDTD